MWVSMLRCPRCGQQAARRSRRVGVWDHLVSVVHLYPFRCQLCTARFRAFLGRHHSEHAADRRDYERLLVRVPVVIAGSGAPADAETVDLSLTGCSLRTEAAFPTGTTLRLTLRLGQTGDIAIQGALVKSQREGAMSVHFTRIDTRERDRLSRYLSRFLRPSGSAPRGAARPRPELVLAAAVGLGVILVVLFLLGRLGAPPIR